METTYNSDVTDVYAIQATLRSMVRETVLQKEDFIYPIFVVEGENVKNPKFLPCRVCYQFSLDHLADEIDEVVALRYSFSYSVWGSIGERCNWYRCLS